MGKIYTPKELAAILGVSERTLARWHLRRIGPPRTQVGKFIAYREESLGEWLKDNEAAFAAQSAWHERHGHPLADIISAPGGASWDT